MKRRMKSSIAIAMTVLLSVMTFVPTAHGQGRMNPIADTNKIDLGPNEMLRVTGDWDGEGRDTIQFRTVRYAPAGCTSGVCKQTVASQETSAAVMLMPRESASMEILSYGFGVRAIVLSDNPNVRVHAEIVDTTTGNIIAVLMPL